MKKVIACVMVLAFAGVLIWSARDIFDKIAVESQDQTDFRALLGEEAARNVYTYACNGVMYQGYDFDIFGGGAQVPDSAAHRSSIERCLEHRNEQLGKWDGLVESADAKDILARVFFYKGNLHYADAFDNRNPESANLAVKSLEASLSYESGFIEEGFSGFDYNRRELIEMARNLRDELEIEEERKKREEQAAQPNEQEQSDDKKGEVGGIEVSIMEQGVQP